MTAHSAGNANINRIQALLLDIEYKNIDSTATAGNKVQIVLSVFWKNRYYAVYYTLLHKYFSTPCSTTYRQHF